MLIFTKGATTITVADEWREPPRVGHSPYRKRGSRVDTFDTDGTTGEVYLDLGQDLSKAVRLASTENVGFLTRAEALALETLYAEGEPFTVTWDRWPDAPNLNTSTATKNARFLPDFPPEFTLVNEQVDYWYMDMILRISEVA